MLDYKGHVPLGLRALRFAFTLTLRWLPEKPSECTKTFRVPARYRVLEGLSLLSYAFFVAYYFLADLISFSTDKLNLLFLVLHSATVLSYIIGAFRLVYFMVRRRCFFKLLHRAQFILRRPEFLNKQEFVLTRLSQKCLYYLTLPLALFMMVQVIGVSISFRAYVVIQKMKETSGTQNITEEDQIIYDLVKTSKMEFESDSGMIFVIMLNIVIFSANIWVYVSDAYFLTLVSLIVEQLRVLRDSLGPALAAEVARGSSKEAWRDPVHSAVSLHSWIRFQQALARFLEELNTVWTPFLVTSFAEYTCLTCFLAFAAAQITNFPSFQLMILGYVSLFLLPLFLSCHAGHLLKQAGEGVSEAAHRGPWLGASPELISGLQLLALDCRRSFLVRGGPFFTLSLEFFASVVGAVLTYFIVLLQIKPAQ